MSDTRHHLITTYGIAADCPHKNPDEDVSEFAAAFDGLDYEQQKAHPLWPAFEAAMDEYEEYHGPSAMGEICLLTPGEGCSECGDPEDGYDQCELALDDPDRAVRHVEVPGE